MSGLQLSKDLAISIIAALPMGLCLVSRTGVVVYANSKADEIFGYSKGELSGRLVEELIPDKYRHSHVKYRDSYLINPVTTSMSGGRMLTGLKKNGEEFKLQIGLTPLNDAYTLVSVIESTNNIIKLSASNDPLTGLPNRQLFSEYSNKMCELALRNQESLSILFIDLDNFKYVNDQYGHQVGDLVLCEVVNLLKSNVRDSDVIARIGGDEFVICMYGVKNRSNLTTLSDTLISKISSITDIKGNSIAISASIGAVITHSGEKMHINEMILLADKLMYEAKAAGKSAALVKEI
jgi:diguanylate cyclase (GGDEF)-like protein/PAS domain S-box-containing protein